MIFFTLVPSNSITIKYLNMEEVRKEEKERELENQPTARYGQEKSFRAWQPPTRKITKLKPAKKQRNPTVVSLPPNLLFSPLNATVY